MLILSRRQASLLAVQKDRAVTTNNVREGSKEVEGEGWVFLCEKTKSIKERKEEDGDWVVVPRDEQREWTLVVRDRDVKETKTHVCYSDSLRSFLFDNLYCDKPQMSGQFHRSTSFSLIVA